VAGGECGGGRAGGSPGKPVTVRATGPRPGKFSGRDTCVQSFAQLAVALWVPSSRVPPPSTMVTTPLDSEIVPLGVPRSPR